MIRPINGAVTAPIAANESYALIAVRCQPNSLSNGPINNPKAYTGPTVIDAARNSTPIINHR